MKDTQAQRDQRGIAIDLVGVRWPIVVWPWQFDMQSTTATFKLAVALPASSRECT